VVGQVVAPAEVGVGVPTQGHVERGPLDLATRGKGVGQR
jgi:hypothetical protein